MTHHTSHDRSFVPRVHVRRPTATAPRARRQTDARARVAISRELGATVAIMRVVSLVRGDARSRGTTRARRARRSRARASVLVPWRRLAMDDDATSRTASLDALTLEEMEGLYVEARDAYYDGAP